MIGLLIENQHSVYILNVGDSDTQSGLIPMGVIPSIVLLKSHERRAIELGEYLQQLGSIVVNTPEITYALQNRLYTDSFLVGRQIARPVTIGFPSLGNLVGNLQSVWFSFPWIVKSQYSHRYDLVAKVNDFTDLEQFMSKWRDEPIIVQEFLGSDGFDIKIWVIDGEVFAARRKSSLAISAENEDEIVAVKEEWRRIALEIGQIFNLRLYGVDLLLTDIGPRVVDINSFPGFKGVPDASGKLVAFVERLLRVNELGL